MKILIAIHVDSTKSGTAWAVPLPLALAFMTIVILCGNGWETSCSSGGAESTCCIYV